MKIAFDAEKMRPGCVLLQATLGCDSTVANRFPVETWLLAPTPGLKVYEITEVQLDQLIHKVKVREEI